MRRAGRHHRPRVLLPCAGARSPRPPRRRPARGCGKLRILQPGTGAVHGVLAGVRLTADARCAAGTRSCAGACRRRHGGRAAQRPCPRCGRPGYLRDGTGWCGPCSRPGPPQGPAAALRGLRPGATPCRPWGCARAATSAARAAAVRPRPDLIARLDDPPGWLGEFVAQLAAGYCTGTGSCPDHQPGAAAGRRRLPAPAGPARALPAGPAGRSGALARVLEDFFTARGLALPTDQAERLAAGAPPAAASMPSPGRCAPLRPDSASTCSAPATAPAGPAPVPAATTPSRRPWPSSGTWPSS